MSRILGLILVVWSGIALAQFSPSQLRRPQRSTTVADPRSLTGTATTRRLAPIVISPSVQLAFDESEANLLPTISGDGEGYLLGDANTAFSLLGQFRLTVNPKPAAGPVELVGRRIRTLAGTTSTKAGLKLSYFTTPPNQESDTGSIGVDIRLAGQAGVQAADSLATGVPTAELEGELFGLFSLEASASLWLWYAYLGIQYNRFWTAGLAEGAELRSQLHAVNNLSMALVVPFKMTAQTADGEKREQLLYVQLSMGGRPDLSDVVFGANVTASFDPF